MKPRTLALFVLSLALLFSGCAAASLSTLVTPSASGGPSSTSPDPSNLTTRTSEGGEVIVFVDWAGPAAGAVFDVTLDTHSVDLDALDLSDAILRNDRGETMLAQPWAAPMGGHHRDGALTFDGDAAPFFAGSTWIELVLSGIGDIPERTLRWEIGS
jgi:hypothetical protein